MLMGMGMGMRVGVLTNAQRREQAPAGSGDLVYRRLERRTIRFRRLAKTTDLPDELKRGVVKLRVTGLGVGTAELFDVAAHGDLPRVSRE
jgi:hypothetical protein